MAYDIVMMVRDEGISLVHGMWGVFAVWPETRWTIELVCLASGGWVWVSRCPEARFCGLQVGGNDE